MDEGPSVASFSDTVCPAEALCVIPHALQDSPTIAVHHGGPDHNGTNATICRPLNLLLNSSPPLET